MEALRQTLKQTQRQMQVSVEQREAAMHMLRLAQKQVSEKNL